VARLPPPREQRDMRDGLSFNGDDVLPPLHSASLFAVIRAVRRRATYVCFVMPFFSRLPFHSSLFYGEQETYGMRDLDSVKRGRRRVVPLVQHMVLNGILELMHVPMNDREDMIEVKRGWDGMNELFHGGWRIEDRQGQ